MTDGTEEVKAMKVNFQQKTFQVEAIWVFSNLATGSKETIELLLREQNELLSHIQRFLIEVDKSRFIDFGGFIQDGV